MKITFLLRPAELLVSLLTAITSMQEGVRETVDIFPLRENQVRQNNFLFTKKNTDETYDSAIKYCRTQKQELFVPISGLNIKELFRELGIQEAWTHLKKVDDQILESTTLYRASVGMADGVIDIPPTWRIDADNNPTIKIQSTKITFGSEPKTVTKPIVCFLELNFPNREKDTSFLADQKKEMLKLIDITIENIENSQKLVKSMTLAAAPLPEQGEIDTTPPDVDLQTKIQKSIEKLNLDTKTFKELLGPITDRNDVERRDSRLHSVLSLAESIREDVLVPFLTPLELLPENIIQKEEKNKIVPFLTNLNKILVKIGTETNAGTGAAGILPNNSPNDFYDVSFIDCIFAGLGLVAALTSGAIKIVNMVKKRRTESPQSLPNTTRPPPGYPLRVHRMMTRVPPTDIETYPEENFDYPVAEMRIIDRRRTLPRNAAPLLHTIREIQPVRPSYEIPLWRS